MKILPFKGWKSCSIYLGLKVYTSDTSSDYIIC